MPSRCSSLLGIFLLLLGLQGCSLKNRAEDPSKRPVVRVGDRDYSAADLEAFFEGRMNDLKDSLGDASIKTTLLESFIEEKLLLEEADKLKILPEADQLNVMMEKIAADTGEDPGDLKDDETLKRRLEDSLKVQGFLRDRLFKNVVVTDKECRDYYDGHTEDFYRKAVYHVREILVDDMDQARKIQASLKKNHNKNFADLARLYSTAPTAFNGGDLGAFERGDLPEEFQKVVFRLAPGTVSKIVRSQYGYHMFLVEEKILAHQQKFIEVRDRIYEKLRLETERAAYEKEVDSLAASIPVQIYRERLGFPYHGTRFSNREGNTQ